MIRSIYKGLQRQEKSKQPIDYPVSQEEMKEVEYTPSQTSFKVWAPTAKTVELRIYKTGEGERPEIIVEMEKGKKGVWKTVLEGNLIGKFYTFKVKINDRWLRETQGIFPKAVGINGHRGAIIDMKKTDPKGWDKDEKPELKAIKDSIIYELHYRDFSIHRSSGSKYKGKYLSVSESKITNPKGLPTGIDHLKELGITHVHLLPTHDFDHIDESQLDKKEYYWGYNTQNFTVPEGSYSSDPAKPEIRIREFKQMVMQLHKAGIRVVMDVVYNHTTDVKYCGFEQTVPGYYYRMTPDGKFSDGAACGNEMASERPMMRKFMIESLSYWVKEYHIDGFRFDLMGLHDIETMKEIRKALKKLDPQILLYGEGWYAQKPGLEDDMLALKKNTYRIPDVAAFSDDLRDAIKGSFDDYKKNTFITAKPGAEMSIRFGIAGGIDHPQVDLKKVGKSSKAWAKKPTQSVSYVSCHDNHCLRDRLELITNQAPEEELLRLNKLAQTIVFTSQGIPFIFAGEEIYRTKQGVENSYESPDAINAIDWNNKNKYYDLFSYYRGLIQVRKAYPAFSLGEAYQVRNHLFFLETGKDNTVAFHLRNIKRYGTVKDIIVAFNSNRESVSIDIPEGEYTVILDEGRIDINGITTFRGHRVTVSPQSAVILTNP